jgi:chemotaxis protein histidine kinase CheA
MIQGFIEESFPMLEEIENLILRLEEEENKEDVLQVYWAS